MKRLLLSLLFLFITVPFWAQSNREIKELLRQSEPFLHQELQTISTLPDSLTERQYPLYLRAKSHFAIAEYAGTKDKIFIFKRPLKKWLALYGQEPSLPRLLGKCLAPVYVHELSHAKDHSFGKRHGFVWPVTVSDEYNATFWQVHFIQEKLKQNPDYYKECNAFMPKKDFLQASADQLEKQILRHYSFLPPPLIQENIQQLLKHKKINYGGFSFSSKRAVLSLKSFFQKGGSWPELKKSDLIKLNSHSFYHLYQKEKTVQKDEIRKISFSSIH